MYSESWERIKDTEDIATVEAWQKKYRDKTETAYKKSEARLRMLKILAEIDKMYPMVYVEGGTLTPKKSDPLTVGDFYVGKYEISEAMWKKVMGTYLRTDYYRSNGDIDRRAIHTQKSELLLFIKKLNQLTGRNYRLPTQIEWEYAARGGKQSKGYKYSGGDNLKNVVWYDKNTKYDILVSENTVRLANGMPWTNSEYKDLWEIKNVGGYGHENELELYDMSGNARELCQDGNAYVYRGGCYFNDKKWLDLKHITPCEDGKEEFEGGLRLVLDAE